MGEQQVSVTLKCFYPPGVRAVKHSDEHLGTRKFVLTPRLMTLPIGRASTRHHQRGIPQDDNALFSSPVVSRQHAEFFLKKDVEGLFMRDCGSMHGTSLNGLQLPRNGSTRVKNHDIVTIGSNVLHGDREYQARQFSVFVKQEPYKSEYRQIIESRLAKIADAERRVREPSVCEIQDPTKPSKSTQTEPAKPAPVTYEIYDDSDFEEEEEDQEDDHNDSVVEVQEDDAQNDVVEIMHMQPPGSSPTNPLNIDDESTMPLKRSTHEGNKPIKRTSIAITELFNDTDEEELDEWKVADAQPAVVTRPWHTITTVEAEDRAVPPADSNKKQAESHDNVPVDSSDEKPEGNVFTPFSSFESSPMTSPAPMQTDYKVLAEDEEASAAGSDSEADDYESSEHEDENDSCQWSVDGDDEALVLNEEVAVKKAVVDDIATTTLTSAKDFVENSDEKELYSTNTSHSAKLNCLEGQNSMAEQAELRHARTECASSMANSLIAAHSTEAEKCKVAAESLGPRTQHGTQHSVSRILNMFDSKAADPDPVVRDTAGKERMQRWVSTPHDVWSTETLYPRETEPLIAPSNPSYYQFPRETAFANQNEYHSWYPVHGLSQSPYPNFQNKTGTLFSQPYYFPKPRVSLNAMGSAIPANVLRTTISDTHLPNNTIGSTRTNDAPAMTIPPCISKHFEQQSPDSRSKLAISTIVEQSSEDKEIPRQITLKRKADLISVLDSTEDHNTTNHQTIEEPSAKPSCVDDGVVVGSNVTDGDKVAPTIAAMSAEIPKALTQEPPRKKARKFSTSARPFLLGALVGGVGVIGALISLPESFF